MKQSILGKNFCKTARCPSSQKLLNYRRLPISELTEIENHLKSCDFCSAELQLLKRHATGNEEYRLAEMPGQLRRLAEQLLVRGVTPFTLIALGPNHSSH